MILYAEDYSLEEINASFFYKYKHFVRSYPIFSFIIITLSLGHDSTSLFLKNQYMKPVKFV